MSVKTCARLETIQCHRLKVQTNSKRPTADTQYTVGYLLHILRIYAIAEPRPQKHSGDF